MMPCGWLLCTLVGCSWMLLLPAHCWIALMSWPTRLGSARPATISMVTGLFCGHDVSAGGTVPATEFSTTVPVTPTGLVVELTVSPAARSAASRLRQRLPRHRRHGDHLRAERDGQHDRRPRQRPVRRRGADHVVLGRRRCRSWGIRC